MNKPVKIELPKKNIALQKGKVAVAVGICEELIKSYPFEDKCCHVEFPQFINEEGTGPDLTGLFKFEIGKKYRITAEEVD